MEDQSIVCPHSALGSKAEELFVCELCSKSFTSRPLFDDHVAQIHTSDRTGPSDKAAPTSAETTTADGKFPCGSCSLSFDTALGGRRHRKFCPARRTCEFCSSVFVSQVGLERHLKFCKERLSEEVDVDATLHQNDKSDGEVCATSASDSQNSFKTKKIMTPI